MKLYRVEVVRVMFVLAEDTNHAGLIGQMDARNPEEETVRVSRPAVLPTEYVQDSLIHHDGSEPIMLGDCGKYLS